MKVFSFIICFYQKTSYLCKKFSLTESMRIISTSTIKKYYEQHADAKDPLIRWMKIVTQAQ